MTDRERNFLQDLLDPVSEAPVVQDVRRVLGVTHHQAVKIVEAFDAFVASPLEANLRKLRGRDLAKRNPMIYTARGTQSVEDWITKVLSDKETSAIEGHIGTFMEEVARIVSGGVKPGSGVDLQIDAPDGTVQLYAIQSAPNTKNAGSRRSDIESLKRAARPLRAARRHVDLHFGVLWGQKRTGIIKSDPDITVLGSDEFWERVSGIPNFRRRLFQASISLSALFVSGRLTRWRG